MGRKSFDGLAHAACDAAVGVRLTNADLDRLAGVPDGTVSLDLMSGRCEHDLAGPLSLEVAATLRDWFVSELGPRHIDPTRIEAARVEVKYDTNAIATDRQHIVHFIFDCRGRIQVGGREYERVLSTKRVWHRTGGG